jgi:membrane protein required for beta-lactamase induction
MIPPLALFGISIAFSFITWGIVLARYLLPELRRQSRADAMQPLILLHCFRFVGLSFLVPGVVSPDLPPAWAVPAAYGDLIAAVLALLAGSAEEQVGSSLGLGVQPLGQRGFALRLLSG